MPPIVEHEQRRTELAEIAAGLIAAGGIEAATVRAVAREAGYSTKVVSHYFADKRALLMMTYHHATRRSSLIADASQGAHADARSYARALLPVDSPQRRNWCVWFAFWGMAIADPELAAEQRARVADVQCRLADVMARDPNFPDLAPDARRQAAQSLFTALLGIAMQAVFDPAGWPSSVQHEALDRAIEDAAPFGF